MPLTPQEVASKVFGPTRMRRGYDENEVDAFLDVVEAELTRLTTENERLRRELEAAGRSPEFIAEVAASPTQPAQIIPTVAEAPQPAVVAPVAPVEVAAPASLEKESIPAPPAPADDLAVEQRVTRMLVLAQQTADAAIREAQADADRLRGSARMEAERLVADARVRVAEEIGALERSKASLESQVEQLEAFEREYRQRLRAYLTMQLSELEQNTSAPAEVEGHSANVLDVSDSSPETVPDVGQTLADSSAATAGLSDPPGFGQVWSPEHGGIPGIDPLIGVPGDPESQSGSSPFDTGVQGQRSGGYGAAS